MSRTKTVRSLVLAILALVVLAVPSVVLADGRVALVVGNSTYAHIGRLPNPDNDAADMSAALRRLGFEVTTELDADRVELTEALRRFTRRSAGADVSLVFYAGHGIEMDGVNYLVPVDARLERDVDVRFETVTVDDLLVSTTGASLRLVILDACRNNPLARSMQRTAASRTVSGGSFADLNEDLLGDETLVAYAAAAGTTAADGRGRNSPYTAALLEQLEQPLEIGLLFRRVRARVLASTNGAQRPHEYHSLVGEHYLTRTLAGGASVTVTAAAPPAPSADASRPDLAAIDVTELPIAVLRELAEAGDAGAQTELGERYEHGCDVEQDYGTAVSWFRRAADRGYAPGQAALGWMYGAGQGVAQDDVEAARWHRRAAEQGNARGQSNLGVMYRDGRGVQRDDAEAVRWFRRAAEQGHAFAQAGLGFMYDEGLGVRRDDVEAVRWYRRGAEQGNVVAQNNLGWMYENGRGVQRDDAEAVRWYRRAAEQGNAFAQSNLGRMYATGRGVQRDDAAAVRWYRRSAEQGHAVAQYNLGVRYEKRSRGAAGSRRSGPVVSSCGRTRVRKCAEGTGSSAMIPTGNRPTGTCVPRFGAASGPITAPSPLGRTTWAGCTRVVAACGETALSPSAGTVWQPPKDISWRRRTSTAFADERPRELYGTMGESHLTRIGHGVRRRMPGGSVASCGSPFRRRSPTATARLADLLRGPQQRETAEWGHRGLSRATAASPTSRSEGRPTSTS